MLNTFPFTLSIDPPGPYLLKTVEPLLFVLFLLAKLGCTKIHPKKDTPKENPPKNVTLSSWESTPLCYRCCHPTVHLGFLPPHPLLQLPLPPRSRSIPPRSTPRQCLRVSL